MDNSSAATATVPQVETLPTPVIGEAPAELAGPSGGSNLLWLALAASIAAHLGAVLWTIPKAQLEVPPEVVQVQLVKPEANPEPKPPPEPKVEPAKKREPVPDPPPPPANPKQPPAAAGTKAPSPAAPAAGPLPSAGGLAGETSPSAPGGADVLALLKAQAQRCWTIPSGWTDPRQVSVTLQFRLRKDGTLEGHPMVVEFPASLVGKAAADNAETALLRCAPYRLPADKYDQWKDVELRFAPGQ